MKYQVKIDKQTQNARRKLTHVSTIKMDSFMSLNEDLVSISNENEGSVKLKERALSFEKQSP